MPPPSNTLNLWIKKIKDRRINQRVPAVFDSVYSVMFTGGYPLVYMAGYPCIYQFQG